MLFVVCCLYLFVVCCWFVVDVLFKCAVATIPVNEVQHSKRSCKRSHPSAFQPWHVRFCWSFVWFLWWIKGENISSQHSWVDDVPNFPQVACATVDGSEIRLTTWDVWNPVNDGRNYQPQQVQDFRTINSRNLETKVFDIETQSLQYQVTIPPRYLPPHARVTWIRDPRFFRVAGWRVTHGLIANLMFSNKGVVRSKSLKKIWS